MRRRHRFAAAAFAALFTLATTNAQAAAPSQADLMRARALFDAGGRAYDDAKFDVALKAFEQAFAVTPREGLLFSMAQAHRRLYTTTGAPAHHAEAVLLYRQYVTKSDNGARKADAVRALEELEARPPTSTSTDPAPAPAPTADTIQTTLYAYSSTPGVVVSLDGAAPVAPDTFTVAPGVHRLKFSAPGFKEHEITVEALPGQLVPVSKDLEEKAAKLKVETTSGADVSVDGRFIGETPLPGPLELPSGSHSISIQKVGRKTHTATVVLERDATQSLDVGLDTTTQRDVSFGILGAAGAALIGSGVLAGFAITNHNDARDLLDARDRAGIDSAQLTEYEDARSERDRYVILSAAVGGGALALGVLGLGLMLVDPPEREVSSAPGAKPDDDRGEPRERDVELVGVAPIVGPDSAGAHFLFSF